MDYEKKYKESLALMVDCIPDKDGYVHVRPQDIFSKLKESEEERIRKEIIYHIKNCDDTIDEETEKRMIAWLEKQGEQKTDKDMIEALRTEYEKGRADVIEKTLKWLWDLNQEHEIMSYADSHVLDSEELQKYYKNNIEE